MCHRTQLEPKLTCKLVKCENVVCMQICSNHHFHFRSSSVHKISLHGQKKGAKTLTNAQKQIVCYLYHYRLRSFEFSLVNNGICVIAILELTSLLLHYFDVNCVSSLFYDNMSTKMNLINYNCICSIAARIVK